jgi:hypothetical protein
MKRPRRQFLHRATGATALVAPCELPNILSPTLVAAADSIGAFANWVTAGNSRLVTRMKE